MQVAINAMQVRAAKSGVGQYIHALLESMLAEDHFTDFTVYCSRENAPNYRLHARNLHVEVWGLETGMKSLRLLNEFLRLPDEVARLGADVFHGASNFLPSRKVCPSVVTIHDLSYYVDPRRCPFVRRQYWYAMTRRTVATADVIITDSQNSRDDIAHFFPRATDKTVVIPLAPHQRFCVVEHRREKSAVAAHGITRPYILFVGTLEPGKNVVRLIRAFNSLAREFPEHLLVIIGDKGWLYEEIFAAVRHSRVSNRIMIMGHLPDEEIVEFLNFCDVFVFPSLYEGFGLPPLEAMACGAPVVTSDCSSIPEVVGDAGIIVDPLSEKDIAKAIRQVLTDQGLREELRAKGLKRAAQFSYRDTARQTLKVYKSLVKS